MLGLDGKPQIEKYGIEPFIKECKKSVWKYKTEWEEMSERVGYWATWSIRTSPTRITISNPNGGA